MLAIDADDISGAGAGTRMAAYLERLERQHSVYMPGASRLAAADKAKANGLRLDADLVARLRALAA